MISTRHLIRVVAAVVGLTTIWAVGVGNGQFRGVASAAPKHRATLTPTRTATVTPTVMVTPTASATPTVTVTPTATPTGTGTSNKIQTVFIIMMENHNWSSIKGSPSAPYINNTLLPTGAHAEQYYNPPNIHPSLPNYLWLEAGTNFGITNDNDPSVNHQSTTAHLVTLMKNAGISWKSYQEDISGTTCPLTSVNNYAPKHDPFVYFDDVTNTNDPNSAYCIAHVRPYSELATDLQSVSTTARYNFITPNLCDDMHDSCKPTNDPIKQGDTWLSNAVPAILNSPAYKAGGALFITWDEAATGDGPIGMIVLSPFARAGYSNSIHYTHSSTLRTFERIFNLTPYLGDAANATDLGDLFTTYP